MLAMPTTELDKLRAVAAKRRDEAIASAQSAYEVAIEFFEYAEPFCTERPENGQGTLETTRGTPTSQNGRRLKDLVVSTLPTMSMKFTKPRLREALELAGCTPKRSTLSLVLSRLVDEGLLSVAERSIGRSPAIYRRKQPKGASGVPSP